MSTRAVIGFTSINTDFAVRTNQPENPKVSPKKSKIACAALNLNVRTDAFSSFGVKSIGTIVSERVLYFFEFFKAITYWLGLNAQCIARLPFQAFVQIRPRIQFAFLDSRYAALRPHICPALRP